MNFVELNITCNPQLGEILIAELSMLPFDAFEEIEEGLKASCDEQQWDEAGVVRLLDRYQVKFTWSVVPKTNWNLEWEKHYPPVKIEDKIYVRAHFHPEEPFTHQILITPKMSFGTGHHQTTSLMLKAQLSVDHNGKKVLDIGCGTGVLAILAVQLGAEEVHAIDIDEWAVENSRENFSLNGCNAVKLAQGGIAQVDAREPFDIVLANINRNVLMEQLVDYAGRIKMSGILLISGFYREDVDVLKGEAIRVGFEFLEARTMDNWAMMILQKG